MTRTQAVYALPNAGSGGPIPFRYGRAIETLGSAERLAKALGASVAQVESWAAGLTVPPPGAFLAAIDIVASGARSRAAKS